LLLGLLDAGDERTPLSSRAASISCRDQVASEAELPSFAVFVTGAFRGALVTRLVFTVFAGFVSVLAI
jgi:hypothetical protein